MSAFTDLAGVRCLVLGGGGFIGSNLCIALLGRGAVVHGFGRGARPGFFPPALRWTVGDFADHEAVAQAVAGSDIVFHLIGSFVPDSSNRNPAADVSASILGSVGLLEACRDASVGRVVFVSSGGTVYGITAPVPVAEGAATEPISAYGIGKLAIEKYLGLYRYLHGLDYVALRVANPYGPFQTGQHQQGIIGALVRRVLAQEAIEIWGDGRVVRDFLHVDDVIAALLAAVGYAGAPRVFNVGSGIGRSINDVLRDLETVLDRGFLPRRYAAQRRADVPFNVLDIGLIRREMGWTPATEWMDGLRATVAWNAALNG